MTTLYTGASCTCRRGPQRDNCSNCEGTGRVVDFAAMRRQRACMHGIRPVTTHPGEVSPTPKPGG